jgi:hypothetical protein
MDKLPANGPSFCWNDFTGILMVRQFLPDSIQTPEIETSAIHWQFCLVSRMAGNNRCLFLSLRGQNTSRAETNRSNSHIAA